MHYGISFICGIEPPAINNSYRGGVIVPIQKNFPQSFTELNIEFTNSRTV